MEFTVDTRAAKILCIEYNVAVVESRCAVLKTSGYDVASTSPQLAEIVLRSQKFDLIVLSWVRDYDLQQIINLADGAGVLVLEELTMPSQLLSLVAQRLNHNQ
jgi:DNA-binding response OmpR family regulator